MKNTSAPKWNSIEKSIKSEKMDKEIRQKIEQAVKDHEKNLLRKSVREEFARHDCKFGEALLKHYEKLERVVELQDEKIRKHLKEEKRLENEQSKRAFKILTILVVIFFLNFLFSLVSMIYIIWK